MDPLYLSKKRGQSPHVRNMWPNLKKSSPKTCVIPFHVPPWAQWEEKIFPKKIFPSTNPLRILISCLSSHLCLLGPKPQVFKCQFKNLKILLSCSLHLYHKPTSVYLLASTFIKGNLIIFENPFSHPLVFPNLLCLPNPPNFWQNILF